MEVDDIARLTVEFARGCKGSIEASWVATGRNMQLGFEIYGTRGALHFTQERFNELHFYSTNSEGKHRGFQKIEAGPQHAPYGAFCPAPGHQLGSRPSKSQSFCVQSRGKPSVALISAMPGKFRRSFCNVMCNRHE
ncbi:Gfo/Idh/MocA family protein [Erwinia sp. MYb416]|uniref:Gfo/Idh/MocA family protein n=1 Tax=Erwinia sp. MYb416 TaxID=3108532 RepID=UPI0030ACFD98